MANTAEKTPYKVVDSKKEMLPGPSVIALCVEHSELTEQYSVEKILATIAKEMTIPNTDVVQFGNTVFITHISEDGRKATGRTFNVDTAKNFVANGEEFIRHLDKLGVENYSSVYKGDTYDAAFKTWNRRQKRSGSEISVYKKGEESYVFIKVGDEVS